MSDTRKCLLSWAARSFVPPQEAQPFFLTSCFGWFLTLWFHVLQATGLNAWVLSSRASSVSSGNAHNSYLCLSSPFGATQASRLCVAVTCHWIKMLQLPSPSTGPPHCSGALLREKAPGWRIKPFFKGLGLWGGTSPGLGSRNREDAKLFCTVSVLICYCRLLKLNLFFFSASKLVRSSLV